MSEDSTHQRTHHDHLLLLVEASSSDALSAFACVPVSAVDKSVLRKYEVQQKLGKGAYGIVWKATEKKGQEKEPRTVALKKIFGACSCALAEMACDPLSSARPRACGACASAARVCVPVTVCVVTSVRIVADARRLDSHPTPTPLRTFACVCSSLVCRCIPEQHGCSTNLPRSRLPSLVPRAREHCQPRSGPQGRERP